MLAKIFARMFAKRFDIFVYFCKQFSRKCESGNFVSLWICLLSRDQWPFMIRGWMEGREGAGGMDVLQYTSTESPPLSVILPRSASKTLIKTEKRHRDPDVLDKKKKKACFRAQTPLVTVLSRRRTLFMILNWIISEIMAILQKTTLYCLHSRFLVKIATSFPSLSLFSLCVAG